CAAPLGRLGCDYDGDTGARVVEGDHPLTAFWSNASILRHERGASREEAREYAAEWSLQPAERVDKFFAANVEDRASRGYTHCYSVGQRICGACVGGSPSRLRQLMTARLLLSALS